MLLVQSSLIGGEDIWLSPTLRNPWLYSRTSLSRTFPRLLTDSMDFLARSCPNQRCTNSLSVSRSVTTAELKRLHTAAVHQQTNNRRMLGPRFPKYSFVPQHRFLALRWCVCLVLSWSNSCRYPSSVEYPFIFLRV